MDKTSLKDALSVALITVRSFPSYPRLEAKGEIWNKSSIFIYIVNVLNSSILIEDTMLPAFVYHNDKGISTNPSR